MAPWTDFQDSVTRFILWSKDSLVLSTAARVALSNIPYVGDSLVDLYDQMGESGRQDADVLLLQEILARVTALGDSRLSDSADLIDAVQQARLSGVDARVALQNLCSQLDTLQREVRHLRSEMTSMLHVLDRLEGELFGFLWGAADFDSASAPDRAMLLVLLESSLSRSSLIFGQQLSIAAAIIHHCQQPVPPELHGTDDCLWWLSKHGAIPPSQQVAFRELRRITDRMWQVNLRVRALIRQNPWLPLPPALLRQLDAHLSTWLAKYDYLRAHDDAHLALVFVGVSPTNVPFPSGFDAAVGAALRDSMSAAGLHHILADASVPASRG